MTIQFKDKTVLITGGAGFIGSNLAIRLVHAGARVTVLDSMLPDYGGNLFNIQPVQDKLKMNISDMRDWDSLNFVVRGQDYIFNLAGQLSHQDSMKQPMLDMEINVKAQLNLMEACRQFNPEATIVFSSTRQLYGKPQYLPVDEKHPPNPSDVNGINKLAGELYHSLYAKVYGMKMVCLRLTNIYGPRQLIKNARQGFIGWFVNRAITGNRIDLYGGGDQVRDFLYVDDVVEALLTAATSESCFGKTYNLSGEKATVKDMAEKLLYLSGRADKPNIIPFPADRAKIDIGDYYGTSDLFIRDSGWRESVGIDTGLETTIQYYKKNRCYYLNETENNG